MVLLMAVVKSGDKESDLKLGKNEWGEKTEVVRVRYLQRAV